MLSYKPHTITVEPISGEPEADYTTNAPTFGTGVDYSGMAYPETPGNVYEKFGLVADRPMVFMFDSMTATLCPAGSRLTLNSEQYHSVADPVTWNAIPSIAFAVVIAQKSQFQPNT